jgi:hypothetical protein
MPEFPRSLLEFQRQFPDEAACASWLAATRWPDGFRCPACGHDHGWHLDTKARTCECAKCGRQTSVTFRRGEKRCCQRLREFDFRMAVRAGDCGVDGHARSKGYAFLIFALKYTPCEGADINCSCSTGGTLKYLYTEPFLNSTSRVSLLGS